MFDAITIPILPTLVSRQYGGRGKEVPLHATSMNISPVIGRKSYHVTFYYCQPLQLHQNTNRTQVKSKLHKFD